MINPTQGGARSMQSVAEAILQNGTGAIGPGQPMPIAGLQTVAFTLSGTFVATVTFEATTVDDPQPGDWYPLNAHQSGTAILGTTGTAPGIYRASIAGLTWVRARVSAWTSGAVTVNGKAVAVDDNSKLVNANITGSTLPVSQRLPTYRLDSAGNPVEKTEGALLASGSRLSTPSPDMTNLSADGVTVILDITVVGSTSLIISIRGKDPVTGKIYRLNADPTAITAVGTYAFEVSPGASGVAGAGSGNVVQRTSGRLPRRWHVQVFQADSVTPWTYSLGYVTH